MRKTTAGFTIVELLIIIIIIAILAAIGIVGYTGIQHRAADSSMAATAKSLNTTLKSNKVTHPQGYPTITPYGGEGHHLTMTRSEFLAANGLSGLSEKLCIREFDISCYPDLVVGEIPRFDTQKIYVALSFDGIVINYAYWNWAEKVWHLYTVGATVEFKDEHPCQPYFAQTGYDEDCRFTGYYVL
jgi:competence protein ComGC